MTPTVLLIGGGTGGHIHPLLAVAEHLDNVRKVALCSDRAIDASILQAALARDDINAAVPLPAKPLAASPKGLIRVARAWSPSVAATRREIERAPGPVVALSTGGFVSVPAARACSQLGVSLALVALDVPPGKATRWTSRWADRCLNAAPGELPGWERTGPILRAAARPTASREDACAQLGLDPSVRTLVVFGGSQGARTINRFLAAMLRAHPGAFAGWQVLHQCGAHDLDEANAIESSISVRTVPFIDRPGDAWSAADLVLARAGAGTVAEAALARTPTVFMPYPFHADRHQEHNARPLVDAGAAVAFRDHVEPEANLRAHADALADLLTDPDRRAEMARRAAHRPEPPDGAAAVAAAVRALLPGADFGR